ncbi:MAG: NADH-quinone oxidoreductase subunit E [Azospirillum sp.]|nr:NADH-quinone oxidoreductase subunit E [Azospirillum sp.]
MNRPAHWDETRARRIIADLAPLEGAALPILQALQDTFGYVDRRAVPLVAEALGLSRAEVTGTIAFYHDFRTAPPGRHRLQLCRAEACQACGCETLVAHLDRRHGIAVGSTTADGALTVDEVYCLGNCALGPALLVDGEPVGRADAGLLDWLVADLTGGPA